MVLRVIVIAVGHVVVLCGWVGGFSCCQSVVTERMIEKKYGIR